MPDILFPSICMCTRIAFLLVTIAVIGVIPMQKALLDLETRATPITFTLDKGDIQPLLPTMGQDGLKVTLKTLSGKVNGYYSYGQGKPPDALKHDGILKEGITIIPQTSCNPETKISLVIHGVHSPYSKVQYEDEPAKLSKPPPCVTTTTTTTTSTTTTSVTGTTATTTGTSSTKTIKPIITTLPFKTPVITTSSPIISIPATISSDSGTDLTITFSAPITFHTEPALSSSDFGIEVEKDPEYDSAGEREKPCRTKKYVVCLTVLWTTYYL